MSRGKISVGLTVIPGFHAVLAQVELAVGSDSFQEVVDVIRVVEVGQFIDEAVDSEGVEEVANGAHPTLANMILRRAVLGADVGYVEEQLVETHTGFEVGAIFFAGSEGGSDRRERAAEEPRLKFAGSIEAALHMHGGHGVKVVEAYVVLASPDHFDGLARGFREQGRLDDVIGFRLAAEAAAEQGDVAGHIFRREPESGRDRILNGLRVLRRTPGFHFAGPEFGHRDRRLHGSVGQHGHVVIGLELFGGAGESTCRNRRDCARLCRESERWRRVPVCSGRS